MRPFYTRLALVLLSNGMWDKRVQSFTLLRNHDLIAGRKMTKIWAENVPSVKDQDTARRSLEQMLEKQRTEMHETEELLKKLSSITELSADADNPLSSYEDLNDGTAASYLSGVDYGFLSRSEGATLETFGGLPIDGVTGKSTPFEGYGPPANILKLGGEGFKRNFGAIRGKYENVKQLRKEQIQLHVSLKKLKLNVTEIWERESKYEVEAPFVLKIPYYSICYLLDYVFEGRYIPGRFYFLETVARVPYFSYISMLHLYETLGWWRRSSDVKRVHFAEEWNEYNHLLIMESLGGDQEWWVRFLANHAGILYYWTLVLLWALSPTLAYKFSEMLEIHAVNTYGVFLDDNEELLKELPPSLAAVEYYALGATDPLFDEYQTISLAQGQLPRRPGNNMNTLFDVFSAIRDDEGDHVATMKSCLDPAVAVKSPTVEKTVFAGVAIIAAFGYVLSAGDVTDLDLDLLDNLSNIGEGGNILDLIIGGTAASAGKELLEGEKIIGETALEDAPMIGEVMRLLGDFVKLILKL